VTINPKYLLRLELAADDAPGVSHARTAISEVCAALGVREATRDSIRLAVTEACTNCVLHAYDGAAARSSYLLQAHSDGRELVVVVQDWGAGIPGDGDTRQASAHPGLGSGLPLIRKLACAVDVASTLDQGTRIEMRFRLH